MTDFEEKLKKMYQRVHRGLLEEAQGLQQQRNGKLQQAAALEEIFGFSRNASEKLEHVPTASYAGMVDNAG